MASASSYCPAKAFSNAPRALGECRQVVPALSALNRRLAVPRRMVFQVRPGAYIDGRVSPERLGAWIRFFRDDPARITALRSLILAEARKREPKPPAKPVFVVELSDMTYFPKPGIFRSTLGLFLGIPFVMLSPREGGKQLEKIVYPSVVYLDAGTPPALPDRL